MQTLKHVQTLEHKQLTEHVNVQILLTQYIHHKEERKMYVRKKEIDKYMDHN